MGLFASFAPTAFSSALSFIGGNSQNDAASDEASNARWFDRWNYKHRYQWQVGDMRKAGLNPILAATQGAPSLPGADTAQVPANPLGDAVNSALAAKRLSAELKNIEADTEKKKAERDYTDNLGAKVAQDYRLNQPQEPIARILDETSKKLEGMAHSAAGAARAGVRLGKIKAGQSFQKFKTFVSSRNPGMRLPIHHR